MDLSALAGRWKGTWRTWVEPDELFSESPIEATVEVLHGGKDAVLRYTAMLEGAVEGFALIGATQDGAFAAWIDTWHTSGLVMASHGPVQADRVEVTTTFRAGEEEWRWTSEYLLDEAGHLVVRHYNEGPKVARYLGVETVLERVAAPQ